MNFFQWLGAVTALAFSVGLMSTEIVSGFSTTSRGSYKFKVRTMLTDDATAQYVNDPAILRLLGITHYRSICWKRTDTTVSEFIYIADEPTTDDAKGWPVVGTEKECQDFDQGIRLYVWHPAGQDPKEIKFLFIE